MSAATELSVRPTSADQDPPVAPSGSHSFRDDIQGLRAIAVCLVVFYHAHVPGLTGGYVGVDIFFVISGFLISGQIIREVERTGRISLRDFYARRMRRLLPLALLVVVVTLAAARLFGPVLELKSTAIDAMWTAAYALNFRLASEGVNYQQASGPESPLQHFWSLAVEEQFYLIWPLLILLTVLVVRRRPRLVVGIMSIGGVAASLSYAIVITGESAPLAYFSVQSRAWEFGIGALLAVAAPKLTGIPRWFAVVVGWLGLAAIGWSAFEYDDSTPFPGTAALVPVLGCAAIILAGSRPTTVGVGRLLGADGAEMIGRFSYGWYLWHWPVLILAPAVMGGPLGWISQVEVSLLALWLAGLTYTFIEQPFQQPMRNVRPWLYRGILLSGATAMVATLVVTTMPSVAGEGRNAGIVNLSDANEMKLAEALTKAAQTKSVPRNLQPKLQDAANDVPITNRNSCHLDFEGLTQGPCVYGDKTGTRTVVLFGDSHAQQWFGALDGAAKKAGWKLVSWTKSACPGANLSQNSPQLKRTYTECDTWRAATIKRISALQPDLVIMGQSDSVPSRSLPNSVWADKSVETLTALKDGGSPVVFIADTPYPKMAIPECVSANLANVSNCQLPREFAYHSLDPVYTDRHKVMVQTVTKAGFPVIEPIGWLCSATECPVIVGNTLVYRDKSHISNSYSIVLAPMFSFLLKTDDPAADASKGAG